MTRPNLHVLADSVIDEVSFIAFIEALATDRTDEVAQEKLSPSSPYGPGVNGWENTSIEDFLFAAASWAEFSTDGMPLYKKPSNPWTRCAEILLMGKHYE